MAFFRTKNIQTENREVSFSSGNPITGTLKFTVYGNSAIAMKQGVIYRIVNMISDTIASLPLIPYNIKQNWKYIDKESELYNLLNIQPNVFMSSQSFKKQIVVQMLLKGNAFIAIDRDSRTGEPSQLTLLISDAVLIEFKDNDIVYRDTLSGAIYDKSQIIHIMNYGATLYRGESTVSYMYNCLNIGQSLDNYMQSLSSSGMMVSGILKPTNGASITPAKAQSAKDSFNTTVSSLSANSVVVLDSGFDFQQISISPKDAKYLESSKLNNETICRFFGVSPALVGVTDTKYTTQEQMQLEYLTNCIQPIIEKIEVEFFRKLYLKPDWNQKELKFDTSNFLRLDSVAQASYFKTLVEIGAMSINEVRSAINANYPAPNGNKHWISTNLQQLDNPIVNVTNSIDNKLLTENNINTNNNK